jgi:2-keto-4-pentenoate hydratase
MTAPVWEDARVARGLERLRELRDADHAAGGRRLGWKTGMGGPVAEKMGTTGALVGYMTGATLLPDGVTIDVSDWTNPLLEPEIAIRMGRDLPAGSTREEALASIDAIASAIEVADVDLPFEDPEAIFGKKLFHRGVILGTFDTGRAGADVEGVTLTVRGREKEYADHVDPLIPIGNLGDVACHVANVVAQMGETLAAGDIVITGSGIPAIPMAGEGRMEVVHHNLGATSLTVVG